MRITLVISSLGAGGAERVLSIMANYWAAQGRDVTLITLSRDDTDWYRLHPGIKRVGLDLLSTSRHIGEAVQRNWERVRRLRHELRRSQPDVVISFADKTNVLTLMAGFGLGIPVIVSERTDPRIHSIGSVWNVLRFMLYRHADAIVVQSSVVRDWASNLAQKETVHIIPNPVRPVVNDVSLSYKRKCRDSRRTVIAMGRLTQEKRFDILIRAFCQCAKKHADWSLTILGEGDERQSLETLTHELGLKDRVRLPGLVQDSTQALQDADLFAMSSRYEGFPNALLEAMACGLAVISTDCPSGPREIIRDGVDGVLVPLDDVEALTSAMDRLMTDHAARQSLGAKAAEVIERFSITKIMRMWDNLITQVCSIPTSNVIRNGPKS